MSSPSIAPRKAALAGAILCRCRSSRMKVLQSNSETRRSQLLGPPDVPLRRPWTRNSRLCSLNSEQVPAGSGQGVQSVHSRLDQLLRPLLSDAVASDPEEDRCLCHPLGAPQVQAAASQDQGGHEIGLSGFAVQIRLSSLTSRHVMATAEHREPYESRGSRTVLGAPGGKSPPGDSPNAKNST